MTLQPRRTGHVIYERLLIYSYVERHRQQLSLQLVPDSRRPCDAPHLDARGTAARRGAADGAAHGRGARRHLPGPRRSDARPHPRRAHRRRALRLRHRGAGRRSASRRSLISCACCAACASSVPPRRAARLLRASTISTSSSCCSQAMHARRGGSPRLMRPTCTRRAELHAESVFKIEGMDCHEEVAILEHRLKGSPASRRSTPTSGPAAQHQVRRREADDRRDRGSGRADGHARVARA